MTNSEIYNLIIDEEHAGERIDSVLSLLLEDVSRSYIQRLIEGGNVSVGGIVTASKKVKLKSGDAVSLVLPPPIPCAAQPEDIP